MTLEEAKKEICERKNMYDSIVDRIKDQYNTARDFYKGEASGLSEAMDILEKAELVGNPERLTLTELAHELRKISDFIYLTCEKETYCLYAKVTLHWDKPEWSAPFWYAGNENQETAGELMINPSRLDLSEYADENGKIDYSKCIVEVE